MEENNKNVLVWKKSAWTKCYPLYERLVECLTEDLNFTCTFASLIDPAEIDICAKFIVNIFTSTGHTLPLINTMVSKEFSKVNSEGEGSVLRGNSVINKIEGVYLRAIGGNYLRLVLADLVTKVVADKDLQLEVDPRKINVVEEDIGSSLSMVPKSLLDDEMMSNVDDITDKNCAKLQELAQMFLDRITDPVMVEEMPKEMRTIAVFTAYYAKKYAPDSFNALIGGFVMLRFFSPAIATPETSKLIPPDLVPSNRAKRNLVLLAKVLQNASNGVLFGGKEEYMTCMNSFIVRNKPKMTQYFMDVIFQSERSSSPGPRDTVQMDSNTRLKTSTQSMNKLNALSPALGKMSLAEPPTSMRDLRSMDIQDLFDLHRVLEQTKDKIAAKYQQHNSSDNGAANSHVDHQVEIFKLLKDLGPSPKSKLAKKPKEVESERDPVASLAPGQATQMLPEDVLSVFERARFLYAGPNDKHDRPVFYLIINRIKIEFLENINPLVKHIHKVMDSTVSSGYSMVIDMSWANMNSEFKRAVYGHLPQLSKIFSRKFKKNVHAIYIVHPSAYTRAVVHFMRFFTSRKLTKKIHEVYNWKQLIADIDPENIQLPDTSKDYITKSYRVIKVNAKGKKQERIIKFTPNSLLNIDPKTKKIRNEKRIDEIEEISSTPGSNDISMKFTAESVPSKKNKKGILKFSSKEDLFFRRYVCPNAQQRDCVLQDVFETGFKSYWMKPPRSFNVVKINQAGKAQERTFKLTIDSLLNIDHHSLKSETSFAGIEEVSLDPTDSDTLWMKLKSERFKRKIICKGGAKELVDVLNEGLQRYTQVFQNEEGALEEEGDEEYNDMKLR